MQNRNLGKHVMTLKTVLKGPSNDTKEECRSTHACFKDCLTVMVHKSGVYSPIAVKFSGFVLLINAYNLPPRTSIPRH